MSTHKIPQGMRPGRRELNEASLNISFSDAVPVGMRDQVREVTSLFVPVTHRHKRLATLLMNLVCQEADANRVTLILTCSPTEIDGISADELQAWYERFGFQPLQDSAQGWLMARQVRRPVRPVGSIARARINRSVLASIVH